MFVDAEHQSYDEQSSVENNKCKIHSLLILNNLEQENMKKFDGEILLHCDVSKINMDAWYTIIFSNTDYCLEQLRKV